jgi:hypothetical protein
MTPLITIQLMGLIYGGGKCGSRSVEPQPVSEAEEIIDL